MFETKQNKKQVLFIQNTPFAKVQRKTQYITNTVYVVIFASQSSRKFPLQYMAIYSYNENIMKIAKLSPPSPKSQKYLYAKYMPYTVLTCIEECATLSFQLETSSHTSPFILNAALSAPATALSLMMRSSAFSMWIPPSQNRFSVSSRSW